MPQMNAAGLAILKASECCVLYAYDDYNDHKVMPGDHIYGTLTIGWGHTGADVHPGQTITQAQADAILRSDLSIYEIGVNNLVTHSATSNQFSALVDFAYNEGTGALASSTLLKKFNSGDIDGAGDQFLNWTIGNGQVLAGLVSRRKAERNLFLS